MRTIEYKPIKGFFNLSKKPDTLSKQEYNKVVSLQRFLANQVKCADYLKEYEPLEWEKLKVFSGQLQQIIFEHWGDEIYAND